MSVKFVHINLSPSGAVCRKIMYAIAKIQISIKGAKKKPDADRADDKYGRRIGIKADEVSHTSTGISEREYPNYDPDRCRRRIGKVWIC